MEMVYYEDVTGNRRIELSNLGANFKCFELFSFLLFMLSAVSL